MTDELDELQALLFDECAEGLEVAECGLSQMLAGDVSAPVIADVFRAVHSIKGGSGAFGDKALLGFSYSFENVLDDVRAGQIAATPKVTRIMLGAFDMLSDHVAAAHGRAAVPDDGPTMAILDRLFATKCIAPEAVPVDDSADEFGFSPVGVVLETFDNASATVAAVASDGATAVASGGATAVASGGATAVAVADWSVRFRPLQAALANGGEPLLSVREIERIGRLRDIDKDNTAG